MNPSVRAKLDHLTLRLEEINALLADPATIGAQDRYDLFSIHIERDASEGFEGPIKSMNPLDFKQHTGPPGRP